jgi:uncharacterized protein (TIGR02996 family)
MGQPSGDELALLKAVAADPADDLPRLVYADWLDEHGRPERAEFIRLQVANEQPMTGWERGQTQSRIEELTEAHRAAWLRELPRWVRKWYADRQWEHPSFGRGFIADLCVYASPFFRFGDKLLDRTPLESVNIYHLRALRGELARCRWLGRVPSLNLGYEDLEVEGAEALAKNRHLGGVRELKLPGCELGDAGVRALAEAKSLTGLKVLDLRDNDLTLAAAKALRGTRLVRGLTELNLRNNPLLLAHQWRIEAWFGGRAIL